MRPRTLAVGACHMNGEELAMGVAEMVVERYGVAQAFLVGVLAYVLEQRSHVEKIIDGLLIVHCL